MCYDDIDKPKSQYCQTKKESIIKKYSKVNAAETARTELYKQLDLTGAEITLYTLPAGANLPFSHAHKQNEEICGIFKDKSSAMIDGKSIDLKVGGGLRIAPAAKRQFFAAKDSHIKYICMQVKENSLQNFTMIDAIIE